MTTSFDFHPRKIETRKGRKTPYRVRWIVAGRQFGNSFVTMALAESFRASLITAARRGEGFNTSSGLPESVERTRRDVSFYEHVAEFTAAAWPAAAAKTRVSIIETLTRVVPVVVRDLAGAPDPDVLRRALRKKLNQGGHAGQLEEGETKAIAWIARASRPAPDDTLDPRAVGSPALVAGMLQACSTIGKRQGRRFRAFYGCMFYALMRPSEAAALTREGCHLPETGWGHLIFADSSPAPGKAYTDDGQVHEHRGLKGRTKGRPGPRARRPVRKVPIPPELTELLRTHIDQFGTAPDGRLFRSESRNPLQPSTWWQVWQKVRAASLTPGQLASPLMKRPYDPRHSGVTWRLNSGVPATEVAAWAGHSVEVLTRVYARCVVGLEGVWIGRMDEALHLGEDR